MPPDFELVAARSARKRSFVIHRHPAVASILPMQRGRRISDEKGRKVYNNRVPRSIGSSRVRFALRPSTILPCSGLCTTIFPSREPSRHPRFLFYPVIMSAYGSGLRLSNMATHTESVVSSLISDPKTIVVSGRRFSLVQLTLHIRRV